MSSNKGATTSGEEPTELGPRRPDARDETALAFRVTVIAGPGASDAGKGVTVEPTAPASLLIGTSVACQLRLSDPTVSRRHASLEVTDHHLRVTDLGSTNGTTINGVRVGEAFLRGGETLGIGGTTLHVERQNAPPSRLSSAVSFGRLIGASAPMRRLYPLFERVAASDIPLVIEGETGVGKELLAESIHDAGPRKNSPFVVLDCSTVAPARIEGVLFGTTPAADPTAQRPTPGVFESADKGTLLIDEITELEPNLQRKLLRAIERGEICRAGSDTWVKVDVRVIATTGRDLDKEVEAGKFRDDLFFRLAVGRIELPPLRRRGDDVALLADYFWKRVTDGGDQPLPHDFLRRYEGYPWPGNVRELQNVVTRRHALGDADPDRASDENEEVEGAPENAFRWAIEQDLPFTSARDLVTAEFTRHYVKAVLAQHGGNVSRAAAASGLARRYFQLLHARQRTNESK